MSQNVPVRIGPGRLVAGSLYSKITKDHAGVPLVVKNGDKKGQPTWKISFGVAIPKTPGVHWGAEPWGQPIWAAGYAAFPQAYNREDFAWKIEDGDSTKLNKNNKRPCDREGFPGHWVVFFSCYEFAPEVVTMLGSTDGRLVALPNENAVNLGDYVEVSGSVKGNGSTANPGVFLNFRFVCLNGYGPRIVVGLDPNSVGFSGAMVSGASAVPLGGAPTPPPGAVAPQPPVPPGAVAQPPAPPGAVAPPPAVQQVAVTPHTGFLPPQVAGQVQVPGAPPASAAVPPPPPAAAARVMSPTATATYEVYINAGWTDDQLRANGLLLG